MSNIATDLGRVNRDSATGNQRLYRMEPPISANSWDDDAAAETFSYVVVSAVNAMFSGPETYIFGADDTGQIVNWLELSGSFKGALDHEQALSNAGYSVRVSA